MGTQAKRKKTKVAMMTRPMKSRVKQEIQLLIVLMILFIYMPANIYQVNQSCHYGFIHWSITVTETV